MREPDDGPRDTWYVASRTRHAARWRALRSHGVDVACSWIDEAGLGETVDWEALWHRCAAEAKDARTFILFADEGDEEMRGALVEAGIRIGAGLPLWVVTPDGFLRSLERHPEVWPADAYIRYCIERVCREVPPSFGPTAFLAAGEPTTPPKPTNKATV